GAIQRIEVEAFRCCLGGKGRRRRSRRWRRRGRSLHGLIASGRIRGGGLGLATTHFRLQGKLEETQFRVRFPTQPTESLAYGCFAETKPSRNPSVAVFFGLEAKDGAIALGDFLRHRN